MEQLGVLQRILNAIEASLGQGGVHLYPIVMGYMDLFTLLALAYTAYGILRGGRALSGGLELLLRVTLVVFAIDTWPWFLGGLRDIALSLGLAASGGQLKLADFLDPGALGRLGLESGGPLWTAFRANLGVRSFPVGFGYLLAWIGYIAAFAVMAYKVFWWQVELLIAGLAGMCLLPALAFRPVAFVGSGVLSYPANAFARFLLGALLAGALWDHLKTLTQLAPAVPSATADMTMQSVFVAVGMAWVLGACFLTVNRLAGMLTSGVPGMAGGSSFGSFLRSVAGVGAALLTGAAAGTAGVVGAARGTAAAGQALGGGLRGVLVDNPVPHSLGEAARNFYAGARNGVQDGLQSRLGQYMDGAAWQMVRSGQTTLHQLGQSARQGGHDQTHTGVRR